MTTISESPSSIFRLWEAQLKDAVKNDNLELVKELSPQNPDLFRRSRQDTFSSCLLTAISKCNCDIAEILLKNGARMPNDGMWLLKLIERDDEKEAFCIIFQKAIKLIGTLIQNGISLEYLLSMYYKIPFDKRCDDNTLMEVLIEGLFERINYPIDYIVKTFVDSTSELEIFWLVDYLTSCSDGRIQLHHFSDYIEIKKTPRPIFNQNTETESVDETETVNETETVDETETVNETETVDETETVNETESVSKPLDETCTRFINQVITRYTGQEKLQEFLDLIHNSGSYISGSSLLKFNHDSDLDIFIKQEFKQDFDDFFIKNNYNPENCPLKYNTCHIGITSETVYHDGPSTFNSARVIDLIVTPDPLKSISSFDLTCCMNWFNGKEIYYLDTTAYEADNPLFAKYPIRNNPDYLPKKKKYGLYNLACNHSYKEYRISKYNRIFDIVQVHSATLFNPEIMYDILKRGNNDLKE